MRNLRVMVVDDSELVLEMIAFHVQESGKHEVSTYKSGFVALEHLEQVKEPPDIIFCDLNMPEMDGIEFLRHLADRQYGGGLVLISGEDARLLKSVEKLASEHHLNVFGSISKPFSAELVVAMLNQINNRRSVRNQTSHGFIPTTDELRNAISEQEIVPFYQPKVDATSRVVVAVESLARWKHPTQGLVPPGAFISLAEENNLINELTDEIVRQSIHQLAWWNQRGIRLKMALNVSLGCLLRVDFPEHLMHIVKDSGVAPRDVILEVTESRLMQDLALCMEILSRLRLKGFTLSIDDFGTGYSTLEQLQRIPFEELKIDRSFVQGSGNDPASLAILESSCVLAKKLGMNIVAEGVETATEWERVVKYGANVIQGFYVAKPMPADEFHQWLVTNGVYLAA